MPADPWTLYWQDNKLESCVAAQNIGDSEKVARFWYEFAEQLADGDKLLDLACGNGVVAIHLLAQNSSLKITGVDRAKISPADFVKDNVELAKVTFIAETDITSLPFPDDSFAAVTSQFGLEYAVAEQAIKEAARVLCKGGKICLLMHHSESEIVVPASRQVKELDALLKPGALIDHLLQFLASDIDLPELETYGQAYLQSPGDKTAKVSGQIFAGINRIIDLQESNPARAKELALTMHERMQADQQRLQQMSAAALDKNRLDQNIALFAESAINIEIAEPFVLEGEGEQDALIAWQLIGTKSAH